MKILFVAPSFYPNKGGVEKHIYNLSKELISDNHNVSVLYKCRISNVSEYEKIDEIEIYRNKSKFFMRFIPSIRNIKLFLYADIIHFHDYGSFLAWIFLFPILKLLGKRLFITFHGWEGVFPPTKGTIIIRKIINKLSFRSLAIGDFIEKWYGTNCNLISYGAVSSVESINDSKNIVFLGRLEADTGCVSYLDAYIELYSKKEDIPELIICGDGTLREQLERKASISGIPCKFTGFVDNPNDFLAKAKIVFTSGYLAILEAFKLNKPVISYYDHELKYDYLKGIPVKSKSFILCKDSEEIARSLNNLISSNILNNPEGKVFADNSTWRNMVKTYYTLWGFNQ